MSAPEVGDLLGASHLYSVWERLRTASEAPLSLRESLDRFVEGLRKPFVDAGRQVPDMVYIQLVDAHQRTIRTVRGFGMPLSFEYLPAHSLESEDIQADVVKTRRPEFIAGNDRGRFDQRIFEQYGHSQYSRFWFPLFPVPCLDLEDRSHKAIDRYLGTGSR